MLLPQTCFADSIAVYQRETCRGGSAWFFDARSSDKLLWWSQRKHQWELKFVNCKQFPLFSSLCLTMCLFFFLSNFGRVLLVWLSNSWSQRCFTHFSIPNSPRSITTRLSKPVITAKNTLCLQSKVTDKRMLIKSSSPYHGLCHHRSHEGSWEVVKTDPGIHGELEWQTLCGNCVILSF